MELDFSEQIRRMPFVKAALPSHESNAEMDIQTKQDHPEMAMKNKSVCKICAKSWGSCSHCSDPENEMEEGPVHESGETKDQETKEDAKAGMDDKACAGCDCGKSESECSCAECNSKSTAKKMDKSEQHPDKEDKKDVESEKGKPNAEKEEEKSPKDKKKFPFNKSKASLVEKIANMLQSKIDIFNEKYESKLTFAQLNKVYSRGLNVFATTHKPGISLHQWAIARVNLFLKMLSGGQVRQDYSLLDSDIANASNGQITESGLASYDFINFSDLEFQLAKIALVEAGLTEQEMNLDFSLAEEKKSK